MASSSEVGHAKNVANFQDLISVCTGYGIKYNPSNVALILANLNILYTNADTLMDNVDTASQAYQSAVGIRRAEFEPLKKLATRLVNAYLSTATTKEKKANAKTINAKIQGIKLKKVKEVTPTLTPTGSGEIIISKTVDPSTPIVIDTPKEVSASQQSYDQLIEHFSKLIVLLSSDPLFAPNELDLQTSALNLKLTALKNANSNFGNAYTTVTNTRIARNHALYDKNTGLYDVAQSVKKYVLSVFEAKAPEYKMISKIQFKNQKV